jgi:two-component system KDP operon response regulator KdpE
MQLPAILIIDPDPAIRRLITTALQNQSYSVHSTAHGSEGVQLAASHSLVLLVLDPDLPDYAHGASVTALRQVCHCPILVLSGDGREETIVQLLDAGADEYVVKPFRMHELLARMRVLLRRPALRPALPISLASPAFQLDAQRHLLLRHGQVIHLTPIEWDILQALVQHPGCLLTHQMLAELVWHHADEGVLHTLQAHISSLRRKVEDDPRRPQYIHTVPGMGYRFLPPATEETVAHPRVAVPPLRGREVE